MPAGVGQNMGCRGREFWDCTRLITGCIREEAKVRKGRDMGDLDENQWWENEGLRK